MSDVLKRFSPRFGILSAVLAAAGLAAVLGGPAARAADESRATEIPPQTAINAILGAARSSGDKEPLPPDEAFKLLATADGPDKVRLEWAIHEGYYLYKSRIKVVSSSSQAQLGSPRLPVIPAKRRSTGG